MEEKKEESRVGDNEKDSKFDYIIVIDFEATCDEASAEAKWLPQEIIEFPWVLIDLKTNEIVAEKQLYVSPVLSDNKVTPFCTKLTGITNEILSEQGIPLQKALQEFDDWIGSRFGDDKTGESFCIATDGPWDLQVALATEAKTKNIALAPYFRRFFDLRHEVHKFYEPGQHEHLKGLRSIMAYLGLKFEGKHHSGISDCRNISKIVQKLVNDGHNFTKGGAQIVVDDYVDTTSDSFTKWWTTSDMTLESVEGAIGIRDEEVLNVYQFGSRVYNKNVDKAAHWSFIMITTNEYKGPANFTRGNLHVKVYPQWKFEKGIRENDLYQVLCLFLPPQHVWKSTVQLEFQLSLPKFKHAVITQCKTFNDAKCSKLWNEGKMKEVKKEVVRALRTALLALQLLKEGRFVDYEVANKYEDELKAFNDWDTIHNNYKPILDGLLSEFTDAIQAEREEAEREIRSLLDEEDPRNEFLLVRLLRKKGLDYLNRQFSIFHRSHPEFPNLVQLCYDKQDSPIKDKRFSEIVGVCNGILLDREADWRVVAFPYPLFVDCDWGSFAFLTNSDENSGKATELSITRKLNGVLCVLYWYDGQWRLSSRFTPNGSEKISAKKRKGEEDEVKDDSDSTLRSLFWDRWRKKGYQLPPSPAHATTPIGGYCSFLFQFVTNRIGVFSGCEMSESEKEKEGIVLVGISSFLPPSTIFIENESEKGEKEERNAKGNMDWYEGWEKASEVINEGGLVKGQWDGWADESEIQNPLEFSGLVVKKSIATTTTTPMDRTWFDCVGGTKFYVLENPKARNLERSLKELKREPSELTVVNLLREGLKENDLLAKFPEYKKLWTTWKAKWDNLVGSTEAEYAEIQKRLGDADQSRFAQEIKNHKYKNAFFAMKVKKTAQEYYASCPIKVLLPMLKNS